ncbi:MAG TPA: hypothetical protein VL769_07105 [Acidimicrobiia bacterium]|nr:hypothetical protein [Acidimicrobiia bacterium]
MNAHPMVRRAASVIVGGLAMNVAAIAVVVALAAPATAHTVSGPRPTNYRTTLQSVAPRVSGVHVRIVDLGNKLEVTNRSPKDLFVLGYDGEPYLRIGPRGVYENLRSPATYLNRTRAGTTPVPDVARHTRASTAPRWHRVSSGTTVTWHDHRIHWMGTSPPAVVQREPGAFHRLKARWTVPLRYEGRPMLISGRLDWVPGPSGRPWLPVITGLGAVGFAAAYRKRTGLAIAVVVAMVGIDLAHTITAEAMRSGTELGKTVQFFGDNFVSVVVWVAAGLTIRGLRRGAVVARYGLVLVGGMVALVTGLSDLSTLWKSQLATAGPFPLARAEVAAGLGLGLGVATGALAALRTSASARRTRDTRDPRWVERLVADLDDEAVSVVCSRMSAEEVIPIALAGLASRAVAVQAELGSGALVFVVLAEDQIGAHIWSLTAEPRGLRVRRGTPAPIRAELRTTFPSFMQLLGGTRTLSVLAAAGRVEVTGDAALVDAVEPYFPADAAGARPVATV